MRREKSKQLIFTIITLAWVAVIFSFSLQSGDVSGDMSGSLVSKIAAIFMPTLLEHPEQLETMDFIVRKCAHFTEFMILGIFSALAVGYMNLKMKALVAMEFCVVVAIIDETIQLFVSERTGRAIDVLIDSFGALAGIAAIVLLWTRRIISATPE